MGATGMARGMFVMNSHGQNPVIGLHIRSKGTFLTSIKNIILTLFTLAVMQLFSISLF